MPTNYLSPAIQDYINNQKLSTIQDKAINSNYLGDGLYGTGLDFLSSDNPMYDAYYKANPFVGQTYRKTWIDNVFGGLFRTGYDKWLNEMQLNASQYNAGVVDLQQSNLYNSELAKSDRMRSAGENPDLLGTGDVSDSAGMKPDVQDAQIPEALDLSQVASFAGMIAQSFEGALGMASAGIDLIGKFSQIDSQNIDNASKYQDLALQVIRQNIPAEGFKTDSDYLEWQESLHNLNNPDLNWKDSLAFSLGLSRRARKSFDSAFNSAVGSLPAEYERFKMMKEYADNRVDVARTTSSKFYDESFEVMQGVAKELMVHRDELESIKARLDVYEQNVREKQLGNQEGEADIAQQYLDKAEALGMGTTQAIVENEDFNIKKLQQSIDRVVKNAKQSVLHFLSSQIEAGNSFANYMLYNMMLSDYMHVEFQGKAGLGLFEGNKWLPSLGVDAEVKASM